MNTYTIDGVTIELPEQEPSRWFKRGSMLTVVTWTMMVKVVVMGSLLGIAIFGQNLSTKQKVNILDGMLIGGFASLFVIVFLHLYFWKAIQFLGSVLGLAFIGLIIQQAMLRAIL